VGELNKPGDPITGCFINRSKYIIIDRTENAVQNLLPLIQVILRDI